MPVTFKIYENPRPKINVELIQSNTAEIINGYATHQAYSLSDYNIKPKKFVIDQTYQSHEPNNSMDFVGCVMSAYNNEKSLILSPDIIMGLIQLNFATFVDKNSDELKSQIINVESDGKIKIMIKDNHFKGESFWDDFWARVVEQIQSYVKDDIVNTLEMDFTTTDEMTKIISNINIMGSMKNYFEYMRGVPMCGIESVTLEGEKEDWLKIIDKLNLLSKFDGFKSYCLGLIEVISNFADAFDENYHKDWWDKIMDKSSGSYGSGGSTTYISGWFLKFFYGVNPEKPIIAHHLDVPVSSFTVKVIYLPTGEEHMVYVVSQLRGCVVSNDANGETLRPIITCQVLRNEDDRQF